MTVFWVLLLGCLLIFIGLRIMVNRVSRKVAKIKDYLCANLSHGLQQATERRELSEKKTEHHGMSPFRLGYLEFLICVISDGIFEDGELKDRINASHIKYLHELNNEGSIILRTVTRDNEIRYVCSNVINTNKLTNHENELAEKNVQRRQRIKTNIAILSGLLAAAITLISNWSKIFIFLQNL